MVQLKPMKMYDSALAGLKSNCKHLSACKDCYRDYERELEQLIVANQNLELIGIRSSHHESEAVITVRLELAKHLRMLLDIRGYLDEITAQMEPSAFKMSSILFFRDKAMYRFTLQPWVGELFQFFIIVEGDLYKQLTDREGKGGSGKSFFDSSENSEYRDLLDDTLKVFSV